MWIDVASVKHYLNAIKARVLWMLENPWSAVGNPTSAPGPSDSIFGPSSLAPVGIHHLLLSNLTTVLTLTLTCDLDFKLCSWPINTRKKEVEAWKVRAWFFFQKRLKTDERTTDCSTFRANAVVNTASTGWSKKRGHRLMTVILSKLILTDLHFFHWTIHW